MMALPAGPTAWFRMTNVYTHKELVGSGVPIPDCPPEVIMNNFKTRLGRRVGRMIQSMLSREEHLRARQVITFHNQRDFIFFRAYRYIFENKDKKDPTSEVIVRMHELGPQFTLKLKWLQKGYSTRITRSTSGSTNRKWTTIAEPASSCNGTFLLTEGYGLF